MYVEEFIAQFVAGEFVPHNVCLWVSGLNGGSTHNSLNPSNNFLYGPFS